MAPFLQNLKNKIDFFLRQHLKFSRRGYFVENESKEGLFEDKEIIEREKVLVKKFDLNYLKSNSTRKNYLENLYTIDVLDKYLPADLKENLSVLDIGCKNWFYAKGEYFFFKRFCDNLDLKGIELDTNRLYTNFYSRKEVAKFYMKDLSNTEYISGDFLNHEGKYDYIIWILPFVFEEPLLKWGLPLSYLKPEKMLQHAYESLKEGGKIFIINQGKHEDKAQKELCEKLKIKYDEIGKVKSDFLQYNLPRYAIFIKN